VCRRCNPEIPQRFHSASALSIYLNETYYVRQKLNADDTMQCPSFCSVAWRDDIQKKHAERDASEHCGDNGEQLDTSYDQFEHRLLLSSAQRVEVSA